MHEEYDLVGDREREEPSTHILETSAVEEQHKPEGMVGGGKRSLVEADEDAKTGIRCGTTNERGREGQTDLEGTTTMNGEEADAGIGSTTSEGCNTIARGPRDKHVFEGVAKSDRR